MSSFFGGHAKWSSGSLFWIFYLTLMRYPCSSNGSFKIGEFGPWAYIVELPPPPDVVERVKLLLLLPPPPGPITSVLFLLKTFTEGVELMLEGELGLDHLFGGAFMS
jgi:hypothetical protein